MGIFDTVRSDTIGTADAAASMRRVLLLTGELSPQGVFNGAHSARIASFNERFVLGFSREWIMRRLDWTSDQIFRVYLDARIAVIDHSSWFFANFRDMA